MLTLIIGDAGSGKTRRCVTEIAALVAQKKACCLLVPEQQTVQAEHAMADLLPPDAPLYFEVTNFTRLANTVFRRYGGVAKSYATADTKALLMWQTLLELSPHLRHIRGEADSGLVEQMLSAVGELRSHCIDPEGLERAAIAVDNPHLRDKLLDLAALTAVYQDRLHMRYEDAAEVPDRLLEQLRHSDALAGTVLFADSFTGFTTQQYRVLAQLVRRCELTVTLCLPPDAAERTCFDELFDTKQKLLRLAKEAGMPATVILTGENQRARDPALSYAAARLFRLRPAPLPAPPNTAQAVRVVEATDPYEAADFIAADIRRRVMAGGVYRDHAIVAASAADYAGILDTALEAYDIPCFLSVKHDMSAYEPIKLVYAAYSVVCGMWQRADVMAYLKCGLCGVDAAACDEFELYTERWNISGRRFTDGVPFNMNPDGFTDRTTPVHAQVLDSVNRTRDKLVADLTPLADAAEQSQSVTDHCAALLEFLLSLELERQLRERSEALLAQGEGAAAADYGRLWQAICDALDRLAETLPGMKVNAQTFLALLKLVFSAADIGRIPPSSDEVSIGSADTVRVDGVKHIYLFGVCEGEFPAAVRERGIFSDGERRKLDEVGLDMGDSFALHAAKELFYFWRALAAPSHSVTLVYHLFDAARKPCRPAAPVLRLGALFGQDLPTVRCGSLPALDRLWHPGPSLERLAALKGTPLGQVLLGQLSADPRYARRAASAGASVYNDACTLSAGVAARLYPQDLALTQSRVEQFVGCPFSFFCRYTLSLQEQKQAAFDYANIGSFVHDLLQAFFLRLQKDNLSVGQLDEAWIEAMVEEATAAYLSRITPPGMTHTPRNRHLFSGLRRSARLIISELCLETAQSDFTPTFFELAIDKKNPEFPDPVSVPLPDGSRAYVYGIIDRVDIYPSRGDVYVRVVDYKTGSKKLEERELKYGLNLQLLLYLLSLLSANDAFRHSLGVKEGGRVLPGGVMYLSAGTGEISLDMPQSEEAVREQARSQLQRSGFFTDDPRILAAMERDLAGRFLPVVKNGKPKSQSRPYLKDEQGWQQLFADLERTLGKIATRIKSGVAHATPLQHKTHTAACSHCQMKPICRNAIL
ncbi:MAG: PD-(D/E)XK nuclease family protein [Eubacteriales bacterium]